MVTNTTTLPPVINSDIIYDNSKQLNKLSLKGDILPNACCLNSSGAKFYMISESKPGEKLIVNG